MSTRRSTRQTVSYEDQDDTWDQNKQEFSYKFDLRILASVTEEEEFEVLTELRQIMKKALLQSTNENDFVGVKYSYMPPQAINAYDTYPRIMISSAVNSLTPQIIIQDNTFLGVVENAAHILEATDFEEKFNKILSDSVEPKVELFNTNKVEKEAAVVEAKVDKKNIKAKEQQNMPLGTNFDAIKQHCSNDDPIAMSPKILQAECKRTQTTHHVSCEFKDLSARLCSFIKEEEGEEEDEEDMEPVHTTNGTYPKRRREDIEDSSSEESSGAEESSGEESSGAEESGGDPDRYYGSTGGASHGHFGPGL